MCYYWYNQCASCNNQQPHDKYVEKNWNSPHSLIPIIKDVIIASAAENKANLNITNPTCFSVRGPFARINRTRVTGADLSVLAISLKSSVSTVGFAFICLCSIILFTLERKRKEFITAGSNAIAAMIST